MDVTVSALDVLYMSVGRNERERGELEQRLVYWVKRNRPAGIPADAEVRLDYSRAPNWPLNTILSMDEFLEHLRAVRRLVSSARPLRAEDLALPEDGAAGRRSRSTISSVGRSWPATRCGSCAATCGPCSTTRDRPDLEALRAVLLRDALFGIYNAVPLSATGATPADRADPARAGHRGRGPPLRSASPRSTGNPSRLTNRCRSGPGRSRGRPASQLVFGRDFLVLPRFKSANPDGLDQAFAASTSSARLAITTQACTASARCRASATARAACSMLPRYVEAMGTVSRRRLHSRAAAVHRSVSAGWGLPPACPKKHVPPGRVSLVQYGRSRRT